MSQHSIVRNALSLLENSRRLTDLIPKLYETNERCALAAKPLARLSELNLEQRRQLAKQIRAANEEWENVTREIKETLNSIDETRV